MADEKDNDNIDTARSPFLEEKAFKSRTVLVFGTINDKLAADVSKRSPTAHREAETAKAHRG